MQWAKSFFFNCIFISPGASHAFWGFVTAAANALEGLSRPK